MLRLFLYSMRLILVKYRAAFRPAQERNGVQVSYKADSKRQR